jgi:hypothetical protein
MRDTLDPAIGPNAARLTSQHPECDPERAGNVGIGTIDGLRAILSCASETQAS